MQTVSLRVARLGDRGAGWQPLLDWFPPPGLPAALYSSKISKWTQSNVVRGRHGQYSKFKIPESKKIPNQTAASVSQQYGTLKSPQSQPN